jgi:hypothetical protein
VYATNALSLWEGNNLLDSSSAFATRRVAR